MPPSPNLDMAHATGVAGVVSTPPPAPLSSSPSAIVTGTLQSKAGENGGKASFSGRFVSEAVVGVVVIVSMAWIMLTRGWGRPRLERFMAGRRQGAREKASSHLEKSVPRTADASSKCTSSICDMCTWMVRGCAAAQSGCKPLNRIYFLSLSLKDGRKWYTRRFRCVDRCDLVATSSPHVL